MDLRRFVLLSVLWLLSGSFGAVRVVHAQQAAPGLSPEVIAQIDAIEREKELRTPVERKIDSHLLQAIRARQGRPVAGGLGAMANRLLQSATGAVTVDITTRRQAGSQVQAAVSRLGGEVVLSGRAASVRGSVRATIRLERLLDVAARPDVIFVRPRQEPKTFAYVPPTGQGSRSSEGDVTHLAHLARIIYGVDGAGIKIGVISDGVEGLDESQASGDLGPVTILPGQEGSGAEGTAMLEIVHDLAPGAQLYFATALGGINTFAQNIRDLRAAGCDIIVDDVLYYQETPFQDGQSPSVSSTTDGGVVIEAVNEVTASGALYFASAGNGGNVDDGATGAWEGDFADGGAGASPFPTTVRLHDFGGSTSNVITRAVFGAPVTLHWSDPLGGSSNDYDLFLVNPSGTHVIDSSTNFQTGSEDPYEQVMQFTGYRMVIVKRPGAADRYLHLNLYDGLLQFATSGGTHGHNQALEAFAVAAAPAATANAGGSPGPYPNAFSASDVSEKFTSDGPRRIFFRADGTPYTPGDLLASGGIVRQKPDITAADGVLVTGNGGFSPRFFGTSAAAPHAAAIAALIKQARPSLTPTQTRAVLTSSAIDIEAPGVDRNTGAGIVMATTALAAAGATAGAGLVVTDVTAVENPGNGDGVLSGGEGGQLTIALENLGTVAATAVTATLATTTAGVTITQPAVQSYAEIAGGATAGLETPWLFTLASDVACGLTIDFTMTVTHAGGTRVIPVSIQIGATVNVTTSLDGIAPPASPLYTASTGLQTGRGASRGAPSTCGAPKSFPFFLPGTVALRFDAYQFNACPALGNSCATVTVDGDAAQLYTTAHAPTFDPAAIDAHYVGDPGQASSPQTFAANTGTSESLAIVVNALSTTSSSPPYRMSISGLCGATCTRNGVPTARVRDVTVLADANGTASASIDNGSSDPDGQPLTITASPAGPYPVGTTSVRLTVTDPSGAASQATANVTVRPSITAIAPASGPEIGGTVVTITGAGFSTAAGATTILFGAVAATDVTCASSVQCQATAPAGTGTVSVRARLSGQTSPDTTADDYAYIPALTYLLAEGATGDFFDEDILIANPNSVPAPVTLTFFKEDGISIADTRTLAPHSRTTVHVDAMPGLEATSAAVEVTSTNGVPLAVERSMFWDASYYAGHTTGAVAAAARQWYFAEGSQGFFDTYLLLVNPSTTAASVTLTFLIEGGAPVVKTFPIGASSRLTVWAGSVPDVVDRSFGVAVDATRPVIAERSMYFGSSGARVWSGGHASGGNALASRWYFAEGATGGFFSTFLLIGNPQSTEARVQMQYLLDTGEVVTVPKIVPAHGRLTIDVAAEPDMRLANAAFSTTVSADVPVVVERSMYWPGAVRPWGEAHNSTGTTQLATSWALAEGRVGGAHNSHTYILLGNPQSTAAEVTVTFLREAGAAPIVKTYSIPPTTRFSLDVNGTVPELAHESFGARIDVTNDVPIMVERSLYWDANGIFWAGGTNGTGVRLP